ncbi:Caffeine dehydrogenase subunit alpha [Candidatus Entotheonellaceae bacterium PAL068K]
MTETGTGRFRVDPNRLVRGQGQFLDDVKLPGMCHAAFVRSPHAHAAITRIGRQDALRLPGAIAVLTPDDLLPHVNPVRPGEPGVSTYARAYDRYPLPREKVTFSGEAVAAMVAESRSIAEDMVDVVQVEYDILPAVLDVEQSLAVDAPRIHPDLADNTLFYRRFGDGDVDRALQEAAGVFEQTFTFPRQTAIPIEARGVIAAFDPAWNRFTIWSSTQSPHQARSIFARVLGVPEGDVRVIAPDIGGSFGIKGSGYPEAVVLAFLSRRLQRPIKWVEDRREHLLACAHAHEQKVHVTVAVNRDGTIPAIRSKVLVDQGAHALGPIGAGLEPMTTGQSIVGPYRIAHYDCEAYGLVTNKCPQGPYRGVGTVQGIFIIERVMDMIAERLGLDVVEIRRRNLIPSHAFPYASAAGRLYDSGDYAEALERVLRLADYDQLRQVQAAARADNHYLGIGVACFVEHTSTGSQDYRKRGVMGMPAFDAATVRMDARGNVDVKVSAQSAGQGHERVFARLAAHALGISEAVVRVVEGDTDMTPFGSGSTVSRSAVSTGGALHLALQDLKAKLFQLARFFLDTDAELAIEAGEVFVKHNPARRVPLLQVAEAAYHHSPAVVLPATIDPGLEFTRTYDPPHQVFGNGAHIAVVRVDPETALVRVEQYYIVEDCGTILDHQVVEAQVRGAVAQGIGNAIFEELAYDNAGQLLTASLLDYLVPSAAEIPTMHVEHMETPSPFTFNGVKGVGEAGTVGAYAAVPGAVADALRPLGVVLTGLPVSPQRVWDLINAASNRQAPVTDTRGER